MRILVVEDTLSVRLVVAGLLRKWGHEVVEADHGEQAWETLRREAIQFVISDWMMPELTGPELCRRIRSADFEHYIYIILLTSRDDESDLVEGMRAGADDFVTKPFSRGELEVRIKAGERILELQSRLAEKNRELSDALNTVRNDLEAAARTQLSLLPPTASEFGGTRFDWLYCPATYIGGDTLGYFPLDDEILAFYSIDVCGHGVPAALVSASLHTFITPALCRQAVSGTGANCEMSPELVVEQLNREFVNHGNDMYFSLVLGLHNRYTGKTRMCQAAHPHPLLVSGTQCIEQLGSGGLPVAMFEDADYDAFEFTINPGDRLLLYSDGVTECTSGNGESFGMNLLRTFLRDHASKDSALLLQALRQRLADFKGNDIFDDDLSVLMLTRAA
jgi:phosphoserine phosphatase RsbU/P